LKNNKNLNTEFAELIGQMIYELYEMYQSFLRKETLDEPVEPPFDPDDLTSSEDIDEIPW